MTKIGKVARIANFMRFFPVADFGREMIKVFKMLNFIGFSRTRVSL